MLYYDVIIIGGGPAGIALGIELGLNNVHTLILEKYDTPLLSPRAQSLNARSMEFFMRWKLDANLKAKQLFPPDFPIRGVWCSKLNGKTYGISSSNEQLNDRLSPQRGIRIPLWLTENVLRDQLQKFPSVTFLKRHEVVNVSLNNEHVLVTSKNHSNQEINFQASYVVACDGANSITRKKIGIQFETLAPAQRVVNIVFEAPELEKHITVSKGFLYYILETPRPGAIGPVDPVHGLWYAQITDDGNADTIEQINIDHLLEEITGIVFPKKIIQAHFWNMHIQLAERFSQENRVFLVGDSAHAFVPTGGLGLNTALGDVVNLGWKLAAVIQQQALPLLLSTYEQERLPICLHNLKAAQKNADDLMSLRRQYNPARNPVEFAKANADLAKQFGHSLGATMGYAYFDSPLTQLFENQSTQLMPNFEYHPIAAPGYFLPHCWIAENQSIYEVLSPIHWTFIISGKGDAAFIQQWQDKFDKHLIELEILTVPKNIYTSPYLLIRPDWHIAFAGNELTNDYDENCLNKFFRGG